MTTPDKHPDLAAAWSREQAMGYESALLIDVAEPDKPSLAMRGLVAFIVFAACALIAAVIWAGAL